MNEISATEDTLDDAATLLWHLIQPSYEAESELDKETVKALGALYGLMFQAARVKK